MFVSGNSERSRSLFLKVLALQHDGEKVLALQHDGEKVLALQRDGE
jgi:hypothetical protein